MKLTIAQLAKACGAQVSGELAGDLEIRGICTDTRHIQPGEAFLALSGENFDGSDFAVEALSKGAVCAIVSRPIAGLGHRRLLVRDTLEALGAIARHYRLQMPARVAAVTGSAGKSTCKNMLAAICVQSGPTLAARGTENNEVGVPSTLLRLAPEHRFCVLEFGMRGRGEIKALTEIALPEVGAITVIGEAHIGRLGSREAIAESKAEILPLLPADGAAALPAEDFFYPLLAGMCECRVIPFGFTEKAEVRCLRIIESGLAETHWELGIGGEGREIHLPLPGRHNIANALAAAATAVGLGLDLEAIAAGLEAYRGMDMRGQFIEGPEGSTILNDAYNANPGSVKAALEVLACASGRRIFVFGDMLELGEISAQAHQEVGRQAAEAEVEILVSVGEQAALAAQSAAAQGVLVHTALSPEEAGQYLLPLVQTGDVILVKGSRGMQLERTVEVLQNAR